MAPRSDPNLPPRPSAPSAADPDSRARTHLANERTFLAWLRTGLNAIALGLAVAQFLDVDGVVGLPAAEGFASLMVVGGVALTAGGAARYVRGRGQIEAGSYRPATGFAIVVVALVALGGLAALGLIVLLGQQR